jgi:hypothetical protein
VLWSLVRRELHAPELVQFVVPGALVAALLVRNEWTEPAGESRARFATLARLLVPFLAGVALPVALFLVPYARSGSLGAFVNGVFVLPIRRFSFASVPAPPLWTMYALLPMIMLGLLVHRVEGGVRRRETLALAVALVLLLDVTEHHAPIYRAVWYAVRSLLPVLAVVGVVILSRPRDADSASPRLRERTMLLLSVTALCSLVQFPYAVSNYFCYVAPLVALTALALHSYMRPTAGAVPGLLVAFFAAFAVLRINSSPLQSMGLRYEAHYPMATLALERGGIEIPQVHETAYEALVPALRARARGGYTWASPDVPEIYFLSGLRNPTRSLFEFFDDSSYGDAQVLRALDAHGVTAIVLNSQPGFSKEISQRMYLQLAARYPHGQSFGPFLMLWRE